MIEFKDFSFYYPNCKIPSLDKINVIIEEGEFFATGPSGGGSLHFKIDKWSIPNFYGGKIQKF